LINNLKNINLMKNLISILVIIIALTSCSKSDDNNSTSSNIVGKWSIDKAGAIENGAEVDVAAFDGNFAGCQKDYTEFLADGTHKLGDYTNAACNLSAATGTWTKEGNTIKISGGQFATYEMVTITATTMKLKFKNPSIIDEYTDTFYYIKN
jgi:Lipocalin-like domain